MMKNVYFCIALLLCFCFCGCDGGQVSVTETTEKTIDVVTTASVPETTLLQVETTAVETTVEATMEPIIETTAETTTCAVAETTAFAESTAPEENTFMPTVLVGEYTYNDGREPIIEIVDGFTYVNGILIVNKTYSLPENFDPERLAPEAQSAFDQMQAAAAAEGITLKIISGYRPYSQQASTYQNYSARDGQAAADRYSARPGHSEHQTGFAMDINSLRQDFADTPAGKWLSEHCAEYGFIIRYGKDKEDMTGFMYEPWHIRYLGVDLAKAVSESGLCLEEYLGITSAYAD